MRQTFGHQVSTGARLHVIAGRPLVVPQRSWNDNWWTRFGKRAFDILFASLALAVLSPAFLLIAAIIKLSSPGPVFFRQLRHGKDCRLFSIYKFRTMAVSSTAGGVVMQTRVNDERVSRFGAFLRRTSIDELPQLINVLTGDMSVVGPRPHAPLTAIGDTFFETLATSEHYRSRYDVRPGITGLAQISGCRGAMWTRETAIRRLECDVRSVASHSLALDLKIIAKTFISEFLTGKAH
jgi:lipopolysaccharide/colanic/teichoic acid biosynthesis glycosyltransferase